MKIFATVKSTTAKGMMQGKPVSKVKRLEIATKSRVMQKKGIPLQDICNELGVSRSSLQRYRKEFLVNTMIEEFEKTPEEKTQPEPGKITACFHVEGDKDKENYVSFKTDPPGDIEFKTYIAKVKQEFIDKLEISLIGLK